MPVSKRSTRNKLRRKFLGIGRFKFIRRYMLGFDWEDRKKQRAAALKLRQQKARKRQEQRQKKDHFTQRGVL